MQPPSRRSEDRCENQDDPRGDNDGAPRETHHGRPEGHLRSRSPQQDRHILGYKEAVNFALPSGTVLNESLTLLNPGTTVPRIAQSNYGNNGRATDQFVEDGSYLRVKNIQLSYNVPKTFLTKYLPIAGLRLSGGVQNAFTFTKYSGYDPEVGTSAGVPGFDNGRYPSSRMYTFSASFDL